MKKQLSRRDKVIQTALKMISEGGFHASPMSELAVRSGVAVGTIYHHFATKEVLIQALYTECRERASQQVVEGLDAKQSPSRKTALMWLNLHAHFTRNPLEFSLLRQAESSPFLVSDVKDVSVFTPVVLEQFRESVKSGKMKKLKPGLAASLLMGMVSSVVAEELRSKKKFARKELEELADMAWSALRK